MPRAARTPDYFESDTTIYKRDLRRFFVELRKRAHHIYALLWGAPKSVFWIVQDNSEDDEDEPRFSVSEFYANVVKFHPSKVTFRVYFNAYFFRNEWDECVEFWESMDNPFNGETRCEIRDTGDLSVGAFEKEWPHLFARMCRQQILANAPFVLNRETVRRYKFSRKDVKLMRESVARCNGRIVAELREEYARLAAIDCLHEPKQFPLDEPEPLPEIPKVEPEPEPEAAPAPAKMKRAPRKRIMRKIPYPRH